MVSSVEPTFKNEAPYKFITLLATCSFKRNHIFFAVATIIAINFVYRCYRKYVICIWKRPKAFHFTSEIHFGVQNEIEIYFIRYNENIMGKVLQLVTERQNTDLTPIYERSFFMIWSLVQSICLRKLNRRV